MNDDSNDNKINYTDKTNDDLNNKDMNQLYSYTDSQDSMSNNRLNNYNYGNNYKSNNYNYGFYNNQNDNSYLKEGNKFNKKFILILTSCALLASILMGMIGVGLYDLIKNSGQNIVGSNNDNNFNNRTFNNGESVTLSEVNYENFTKITSTSSLDDVKKLFKVNPKKSLFRDSETLTQYTFANIISVTYDDGALIDKIIDSSFVDFPSFVSNVKFLEFQKLRSKMELKDIEEAFNSKGMLTESTYKSVEGYFFAGDSYTWPTDKTSSSRNSYIICDFDSDNNLVRAQNYDPKILPDSSSVNIDKDITDKFDAVHLGMSYEEIESSFNSKLTLGNIGLPDNYISNYYYNFRNGDVVFLFDENKKVFAKWISSATYAFYDTNAQDSRKIKELRQGMSYNEIKDIIGSDGYLCYEYYEDIKGYIWVFDDHSRILIKFDFSTNPDGKATQIKEY